MWDLVNVQTSAAFVGMKKKKKKKKIISGVKWIECIGTVHVLISDWKKNWLSFIAFEFSGFVYFVTQE